MEQGMTFLKGEIKQTRALHDRENTVGEGTGGEEEQLLVFLTRGSGEGQCEGLMNSTKKVGMDFWKGIRYSWWRCLVDG